MTKQQIISVVAFLLLFLVLFFAFDTKSKNKVAPSNSGSLDNTSVDITNELNSAKEVVEAAQENTAVQPAEINLPNETK